MSAKLNNDPRLVENFIPKSFNVGCRRPSPGPGFLEALIAPNTTLYTAAIQEITPKGFLDPDGHEVEVDIIICATGFDTSFRPQFPIIGLDNINIQDLLQHNPLSYLSLGVSHIPHPKLLHLFRPLRPSCPRFHNDHQRGAISIHDPSNQEDETRTHPPAFSTHRNSQRIRRTCVSVRTADSLVW